MLPHISGRPVTMERYPAGIDKKGFIQKDVAKGFPDWLQRVEVPKQGRDGGAVHYPLANDVQSLVWLANQNSITPHVWCARLPLHRPDLCLFDLDPAGDDPGALRAAALAVRDLLGRAGAALLRQDLGIEGLSHRHPARRHRRLPDGLALCPRRGCGPGQAPPRASDPGVHQGRPRRPHPGRHRPQRPRRHLRRCLRHQTQTRRSGLRALHLGGDRARGRRPPHVHPAEHDRPGRRGRGSLAGNV